MYSTLIALATAAATLVAVPAFAATSDTPVVLASAAPIAQPRATQRYCVVDVMTGSRIARRECKTLDKWLARGVDPRITK